MGSSSRSGRQFWWRCVEDTSGFYQGPGRLYWEAGLYVRKDPRTVIGLSELKEMEVKS